MDSTRQLAIRRKQLNRKIRYLASLRDAGRMRPAMCFRLLGLPLDAYTPITPRSFAIARNMWLRESAVVREAGDKEREVAINIAWQQLKNWKCTVCGGVKHRTRDETCGGECARKLRCKSIRKIKGPIILRLHKKTGTETGNSYQGHGLRQAQLNALRNALKKHDGCVADAARELGMAYGTMKHYIRKFGGYDHISKPKEPVPDSPQPT
jgi:hypothetical protein